MSARTSIKVRESKVRMTLAERRAAGKALRDKVSRRSHAGWAPHARREDPVDLLVASSQGRIPHLLPIRYGRMMRSPFAFFRGAAAIMAADLAPTPVSGIRVQACGDCHLMNFGVFATPERRAIFDINDFDETLPAPWEWDVKRLAASFMIAGRNNGFDEDDARACVQTCVRSYRERMATFSEMRVLDRWYENIDVGSLMEMTQSKQARKQIQARIRKAASRSVVDDDFPKFVTAKGGELTIKDDPPLIYHAPKSGHAKFKRFVSAALQRYRETLADDRRVLLDEYVWKDIALKVVGVGSVGTRCFILLLMAGDRDPLFLQAKEARMSVLEPYAGRSRYANRGQRVVEGQRLMQSASDIFLGWTESREGIHFYLRQLRDMKIAPRVEIYDQEWMKIYAECCGRTLACAHAKSRDPAGISGYLGNSERFDEAIADFAVAYANQNEKDYRALRKAIRLGKVAAHLES